MAKEITLDPNDPFEKTLIEMVTVNRAKSADYTGVEEGEHKYQNFFDSGYQTQQPPGMSAETLIATKQARLRILLPRRFKSNPKNESIRDTLVDRAVYSTISVGLWDLGEYDFDPLQVLPSNIPTQSS